MVIKQLQQQGRDFAPRTVAEAVLVHAPDGVQRLDVVLNRKIEHIESEDLAIAMAAYMLGFGTYSGFLMDKR